MLRCAICKKDLKGVNSFVAPRDKERRENWNRICGKKLSQTSRICVDHFPACYIIGSGKHKQLLPIAEPIIDFVQDGTTQVFSNQMLVPEDCIMDFKAEERRTQSTVYEVDDAVSDNTTISASENSSSTPPLLCQLRKVRVRIKKLPTHVLEKYNTKIMKKSTQNFSIQYCRTSKRLVAKSVPTGHYLSLHKNKPLKELVNKQKRRQEKFANLKKFKKNKCYLNLKQYKNLRSSKQDIDKTTSMESNNNKQNNLKQKSKNINTKEPQKASVSVKPLASLTNAAKGIPLDNPSFVNSSLYEKINNTRQISVNLPANQPLTTTITLPNYPEVIITRYELSNTNTQTANMSPNVSLTNLRDSSTFSLFNNSSLQNPTTSYNIIAPTNPVPTTQQNVFPMIISSMNRLNETPYQPPIVTPAINVTSTENMIQQANKRSPNLSTTVQTITRPPKISKNNNDPVIVDSPRVLIIQQPAQKNDPLNVTSNKKTLENVPIETINEDSDIESINSSEAISVSTETEKRGEPEVIKRIIYHTKSAQTKFTCPSNICGLVDTDGFNLNCFYCYDIFPLHKWQEFKEHIQRTHHVEEKYIALDSEEESEEEESDDIQVNESITANKDSEVENMNDVDFNSNSDQLSNEVNSPIKQPKQAETVTKQLTLESRLANVSTGSLNKSPCTNLNAFRNTNQSNHSLDDIISLESDNDEDYIDINEDFNKEENHVELTPKSSKLGEQVKESVNKNLTISEPEIDEVTKLLPPSLSHIKIKKVVSPPTTNTSVNTSPPTSSALKETFIKIPSNFNIRQVIKTIPKSTTIEEIKTNGKPRPRYFVVKKILKPANTDKTPNINVAKGMILTKIPPNDKQESHTINLDDDMPVNDVQEDEKPQPTKGRGILFGITNRMVVIEFLLKLKTYPELWRPLPKNSTMEKYDESIKKLCQHLNNRFDLKMENYEMRLSIQRVKDWYCRMLNNIHEHNLKSKNFEPYPHKFPLYFKILNQFLTSDVNSGITVINLKTLTQNKVEKSQIITTPKTLIKECLVKPKPLKEDLKTTAEISKTTKEVMVTTPQVVTTLSSSKPTIISSTIFNTTPASISSSLSVTTPSSVSPILTDEDKQLDNSDNLDNLIEFDADNLFDTSDDEILSEFDESEWPTIKLGRKILDPNRPKKTKIYTGRFECDMCQKIFKRACDLRRHRVHHFPPQYECSICLQKFYFKFWAEKCNHQKKKHLHLGTEDDSDGNTNLDDRTKTKWPKKIFRFKMICEICGAAYRSIGSLNSHRRDKHLNQRLKCIVCNFTALTNYRIVQHQKKRHIVEPGTVEEVAKKSRARMDSKTPFTVEARQEFDWRREMRAKLKPGEIFFGCCKCRLVFNSRKEKVLHNKMEHPIKETTVLCLLCLPNKMLLSNSNGARRHYTDIHKVPWDEIDALVKRTKPIFNILTKEEIELLNASENYKELLEELLKDREIEPKLQKVEIIDEDEALKAIENLTTFQNKEKEETLETQTNFKVDVVYSPEHIPEEQQDQNVFIDGIIDHDYNNEEEYHNNNEHNYNSEEQFVDNENQEATQIYVQQNPNAAEEHLAYHIEYSEEPITTEEQQQNDLEYMQGIVDGYVEGELNDGDLVEECIVVEEECIDDIVQVGEEYY